MKNNQETRGIAKLNSPPSPAPSISADKARIQDIKKVSDRISSPNVLVTILEKLYPNRYDNVFPHLRVFLFSNFCL